MQIWTLQYKQNPKTIIFIGEYGEKYLGFYSSLGLDESDPNDQRLLDEYVQTIRRNIVSLKRKDVNERRLWFKELIGEKLYNKSYRSFFKGKTVVFSVAEIPELDG